MKFVQNVIDHVMVNKTGGLYKSLLRGDVFRIKQPALTAPVCNYNQTLAA